MDDLRIPNELRDLYQKAFASWEYVEDPDLRCALVNVMCALQMDIAELGPLVRDRDEIAIGL